MLNELLRVGEGADALVHYQVQTDAAPAPGNYSQGRVVDSGSARTLWSSGQTGDDPETGEVVKGGIGAQADRALKNLGLVLAEAGGTIDHIVSVSVFLVDISPESKKAFEAAYLAFFAGAKALPARALIYPKEVPLPGDEAQIEIAIVAVVPLPR